MMPVPVLPMEAYPVLRPAPMRMGREKPTWAGTDAVAFTGGVVVLLVVAVLAAVVPARRAGSADPRIVLRTE